MDSPLTNSKLSNDEALQQINKYFIRVPPDMISNHNKFLQEFEKHVLQKLKDADSDFAKCNPYMKFSGSYYKKTKVGNPDEYDLKIVLNLPFDYSKCQISMNKLIPGFVKIDVREAFTERWRQTSLEKKIVDQESGCLDQESLRRWIEGIIAKAGTGLTQFTVDNNTYIANFRKHGPAETAKIINSMTGTTYTEIMSIDLVPCIEFAKNLIGFTDYKNRDTETMTWFAIPKLFKSPEGQNVPSVNTNLFWRASFYAYEADILKRKNNHGAVNEVIRFMKKLKSKNEWDSVLPSYYLETLFYHEIENKNTSFDGRSMTQIFVHMLHVLKDALENGKIEFFWNRRVNLLENHKKETLQNLGGKISNFIAAINKNINNYNNVLAENLLTKEEYQRFTRSDFKTLAHNQDIENMCSALLKICSSGVPFVPLTSSTQ